MRQLQCDQCGRLLAVDEAGIGVCPSCGRAAALPVQLLTRLVSADDDGATRPVAPTLGGSGKGAPPPSDALQPLDAQTRPAALLDDARPPFATHAETPSESPRTTPSAGPDVTVTATLPPEPARGVSVPDRKPKPGGWGRMGVASAMMLLVVLLAGAALVVLAANGKLAFIGATGPTVSASPTSTPAASGPPAPPAGFHTYRAPDGSYVLWAPNSWSTVDQPVGSAHLTLFADSVSRGNFEIETLAGLSDPQHLDDEFANSLGSVIAGSSGSSSIAGTTPSFQQPVAGILWTHETADVSVTIAGQSTMWHLETLAAQHGGKTYLIAYFAPTASFAAVDRTAFQPMLTSLLFVSPQP